MSYWGATVITNLFSSIPFIGMKVLYWIWGGYSIENATLTRLFVLHFFLPFIVLILVAAHLYFLHERGSNDPLSINFGYDKVRFHVYYIVKDVFPFFVILIFFFILVFYYPNYLSHPDNYIVANPFTTPTHIVPE